MVFKVRTETDFDRIRGMLDLSVLTFPAYILSFAIMGLTRLALPFLSIYGTRSGSGFRLY